MLKKETTSFNPAGTKEKEKDRKQFDKAGGKGEHGQYKPEGKPQQNKAQTKTKPGNSECCDVEMEDEDEECAN